MKAVEVGPEFGLGNLSTVERDDPVISPTGVLMRVQASSLNYRDLMMVQGAYNPRQALPLIPCSDGAGEIVEVGDQVSGLSVGDLVMPTFARDWPSGPPMRETTRNTLGGPIDGTLCDLMAIEASDLVKVPKHLSATQASTLPCAAVTAWNALVREGGLARGKSVVIQGTGGVALFALQIAHALGARSIVLSKSDEKLERAREMGASETINYVTTPDWGDAVLGLTDKRGVDHVLELGGTKTLAQSLRAIRPAGIISIIGVLSGAKADLLLPAVLMRHVRLQGVFVGARDILADVAGFFEEHQLEPVVDSIYNRQDIAEAFEHMASGSHFGKICVSASHA